MSLTKRALQYAVPVVLAGWFVGTVFGQHPDRSYEKIRRLDRTGTGVIFPNWRFFAPNPAVEDQHFLYRLATEDKSQHTPWREAYTIQPRKLVHAVWFPGRRVEKAIFDVASTLSFDGGSNTEMVQRAKDSARKLICEFIRHRLEPEPGYPLFQVMLVRYSGYDHSENPKYDLIFDYERVEP